MAQERQYPLSFYNLTQQTATEYSYAPIGQPDLNQLLRSKPYWRQTKSVARLQKKQLLVADWRMHRWTREQLNGVIKKLQECVNDGFELYIWHEGKLHPLREDNLNNLLMLPTSYTIQPHRYHQILKRAEEQSFDKKIF